MATGHAKVTDRRKAPGLAGPLGELQTASDEQGDGVWVNEAVEWRDQVVAPPPRWRPWAAFVLCLGGVGVSTYLTIAHFTSASILACASTSTINCEKVTTSSQSEIFGVIPVAVVGLVFYVVMSVLDFPAMWRVQDRRVHQLRLAASVGAMGMVIYLLVAELFQIGAICLWCSSVHVITFLLFILTVATVPRMLGWGGSSWGEPAWDQG
jgi:uncharacterized membrane protein